MFKAFPESNTFGVIHLIDLPDPVERKAKQYALFEKNKAFKRDEFGDKEINLCWKLLSSNDKIQQLLNQSLLNVLTDDILDLFVDVFKEYDRAIVKKNLLTHLFWASENDIEAYKQSDHLLAFLNHICLFLLFKFLSLLFDYFFLFLFYLCLCL